MINSQETDIEQSATVTSILHFANVVAFAFGSGVESVHDVVCRTKATQAICSCAMLEAGIFYGQKEHGRPRGIFKRLWGSKAKDTVPVGPPPYIPEPTPSTVQHTPCADPFWGVWDVSLSFLFKARKKLVCQTKKYKKKYRTSVNLIIAQ